MSQILLLVLLIAVGAAAVAWGFRFRARREEKDTFDLLDWMFVGLVVFGILAALFIPMLAR